MPVLVRCNKADDPRCATPTCTHNTLHVAPIYDKCTKWGTCRGMKVRCVKVKEEDKR